MNERVLIGEKMRIESDVTGIVYDDADCVFFRNLYQSAFYVHHGAKIVDVGTDSKGMLVFCFFKKDHKRLINLWMDNKGNKDE